MQSKPPIPQFPPSPRRNVLWIVLGCISILIAISVGLFWWLKSQIQSSGYTTDPTVRQFVIGNDVIELPLNMVRFKAQRDATVLEQAELLIYWPDGKGYTETNSKAAESDPNNTKPIFITLTKRVSDLDMDGRLEPIYMKLFDGPSTPGPAGLRLQKLIRGSGYDNEIIALFPGENRVWTSRCQTKQDAIRTTCLRDVFVGNDLNLRYRFSTELLPQWQEVEELVLNTIQSKLGN